MIKKAYIQGRAPNMETLFSHTIGDCPYRKEFKILHIFRGYKTFFMLNSTEHEISIAFNN